MRAQDLVLVSAECPRRVCAAHYHALLGGEAAFRTCRILGVEDTPMPCSISSIRNVASLSSVSGATSSERLVPGCAKQISLRACALTKT